MQRDEKAKKTVCIYGRFFARGLPFFQRLWLVIFNVRLFSERSMTKLTEHSGLKNAPFSITFGGSHFQAPFCIKVGL